MAVVEIVMPKMGESVAEATIISWLKSEGDYIEEDEILLEVATDKVDSEIPSPVSGRIVSLLHPVDAVVAVGEVLATVESEGDTTASAPAPVMQEERPAAVPVETATAPVITESEVYAPAERSTAKNHNYYSPAVRYLALSKGLTRDDLSHMTGTGPEGRVTPEDVQRYVGSTSTVSMAQSAPIVAAPVVTQAVQSSTTSTFAEVDVTTMQLWVERHAAAFADKYSHTLSLPTIVLEVIATALQDHPSINNGNYSVNITLGRATDDAQMSVVSGCESLNLPGLVAQMAQANESADATFAIRNIENYKSSNIASPRLHDGCSATLALGRITKKPIIQETDEGDIIAIRHMMYVSLSFDQQAVSGAAADSFLSRILQDIETYDSDRAI